MNKTNILFIIPEFSHGGTNKVLENLLSFIDNDKYDINIYSLYEDGGEYYKKIFKPYLIPKSHLYYWFHDNAITRKILGFYNKITKRDNFTWLYKREAYLIQKRHFYDTVIAFQEGSSTLFASHMPIKKRIAWIHCDYRILYRNNKNKNEEQIYEKFKFIVCVSNNATRSFTVLYPELNERTITIHNIMDVNSIIKKSYETINTNIFNSNTFNIISIGRFVKVKQFDMIPHIASKIKQLCNIPFKWYIIGSGDETRINTINEIRKKGLEDTVILLGSQNNPYTYIRKCHLLVCTSHSESYPTVINEAKIIGVPVISNDFPSAKEVINDNCGWICNINNMPELIADIIIDKKNIYSTVKNKIREFDYNIENKKILNTLYTVL